MSPVPIVTNPEAMLLLAIASKAALVAEDLEKYSPDNPVLADHMERVQFIASAREARAVLARLDAEFPGLVPVPHDGVQWKDRDNASG